jgi:hypothetical protein
MLNEKSVVLRKLIMLENDQKKSPISSILFHKKNMLVSRVHYITIYKDSINTLAPLLIEDN